MSSSHNCYIHSSLTRSTRATIREAYARKLYFLSLAASLNISVVPDRALLPPEEDNWLDRERASSRLAAEIEEFLAGRAVEVEGEEEEGDREEQEQEEYGGDEQEQATKQRPSQQDPESMRQEEVKSQSRPHPHKADLHHPPSSFRDIQFNSLIERAKRVRAQGEISSPHHEGPATKRQKKNEDLTSLRRWSVAVARDDAMAERVVREAEMAEREVEWVFGKEDGKGKGKGKGKGRAVIVEDEEDEEDEEL